MGVWENEIQMCISETREFQTGYKEKLFPHEDSRTVEQVLQRGCTAFLPGGFQDPAGEIPEQPGLIP